MANVPAFEKAPAINEIRASLSRASSRLSTISAPLANRSVPAMGVPLGAPPLAAVPLSDLDDAGVPAAHPLAVDAVPVADAAPVVSRALASLDAVPAR